jgi:hypothetical protein
MSGNSPSPDWWITTGPRRAHGRRKLGPFLTRDLALEVRAYVEKVERRDDLWVVTGDEVPDD